MVDTNATNLGADDTTSVDQGAGVADASGNGDQLNYSMEETGTGDGEGEGQEADDHEEIEVDGAKHRIPKALKSSFLMQADYTRKTQELAEQRRALDVERGQVGQVSDEVITAKAKLVGLDDQLKQYREINWQQAQANVRTPAEQANLDAHWRQFQLLKDDRSDAERTLKEKTDGQAQAAHRNREKRAMDTLAVVQKDIPGWNEDLNRKLNDFVRTEFGFSPNELGDVVLDPRVIKLIHAAYAGKQALDTKKKVDRTGAGQQTSPANTLRNGKGHFQAPADTDDFAAFEKMADAKMKAR